MPDPFNDPMRTPPQEDPRDECPDDLFDAVREIYRSNRRLERAVTGDPWNPLNEPGVLREVGVMKNKLGALEAKIEEHIEASHGKGKRKLAPKKIWLAAGGAGAVALFSTLGHFIGKAITAGLAAIGAATNGPPPHP